MANSYRLYTGDGTTTDFSLVGIDGWISPTFIKVYVNGVLQATDRYTLENLTGPTPLVRFGNSYIPAVDADVLLQRETPDTVSTFAGQVVNFSDSSVLTAGDLNKVVKGLLHITQEGNDTGSGALGPTADEANWDANNKRITNLANGVDEQDAATFGQLQAATLFGGAVTIPQAWNLSGTGGTSYALSPVALNTTEEMFLVELGGILQRPETYTIAADGGSIDFDTAIASGIPIHVRNFGVSRAIVDSITSSMISAGAVGTAAIADNAVTNAKMADNAVNTAEIADDAVTFAKMQNVATNVLLGRSSAGTGNVESVACTLAGRNLIAGADAAAQRSTLNLGALATLATISNTHVAANAAIDFSKLANLAANSLLGNNTASAAAPIAISCTAAGRSMIGAANAAAQRALLAVGTPTLNEVGTVVLGDGTHSNQVVPGLYTVTSSGTLITLGGAATISAQTVSVFTMSTGTMSCPAGQTWKVLIPQPTAGSGANWTFIAIRTV